MSLKAFTREATQSAAWAAAAVAGFGSSSNDIMAKNKIPAKNIPSEAKFVRRSELKANKRQNANCLAQYGSRRAS